MKYDFKAGDEIITAQGEVGHIIHVCDCDRCKERGFDEITWEKGKDHRYITVFDAQNGFCDFYQIGKYTFGYMDKIPVLEAIDYHTAQLCEYIDRLNTLDALSGDAQVEPEPLPL